MNSTHEIGTFDAVWLSHASLENPWVVVWKHHAHTLQIIEADSIDKLAARQWGVCDLEECRYLKVNCVPGQEQHVKLFEMTAHPEKQRVEVKLMEDASGEESRALHIIENTLYESSRHQLQASEPTRRAG